MKFQFSHKPTVFYFVGEKLDPPPPGTYDPSSWKPPTHETCSVTIQDDGLWELKVAGVHFETGDGARATKAAACDIVARLSPGAAP